MSSKTQHTKLDMN